MMTMLRIEMAAGTRVGMDIFAIVVFLMVLVLMTFLAVMLCAVRR